MVAYVGALTFNGAYPELARQVLEEGSDRFPRGTVTKELHPAFIYIAEPRKRLVTAYNRPINVAFALAEVLWILAGRDDVAMLQWYNGKIADYSDDGLTFNAAYGDRLRHHFGHDQIEDVIQTLRDDPDSRQATLVLSSPKKDRGWEHDRTKRIVKDRACNVLSHLMITDGKLDWLQIVRSNDLMWGTPYNWMQFSHLQEYIATRIGVPVGSYYHLADSLHIYDYHFAEAKNIQGFDLYAALNKEHDLMLPHKLEDVLYVEHNIRSGLMHMNSDDFATEAVAVGAYWANVMCVLYAHTLYLKKANEQAYEVLRWGDDIYAAAQARFWWAMRWHKDPGDIGTKIQQDWPEEVAKWIMTTPSS